MSEDLTKLESLSYRPAKSSPATSGFNSAVIRPAMRVNKAKDGCPLKVPLKSNQQPICGDKCTEQRFNAPYKENIGTKDKPDYRAVELKTAFKD